MDPMDQSPKNIGIKLSARDLALYYSGSVNNILEVRHEGAGEYPEGGYDSGIDYLLDDSGSLEANTDDGNGGWGGG